MPECYEVTRGLVWGRLGEMASAHEGEAVTPEEFLPERWEQLLAEGLVRLVPEVAEVPESVPPPPPPAGVHTQFVAPVDQPPGQPHKVERIVGGPEAPGPRQGRRRLNGQFVAEAPKRQQPK